MLCLLQILCLLELLCLLEMLCLLEILKSKTSAGKEQHSHLKENSTYRPKELVSQANLFFALNCKEAFNYSQ